MELAGWTLLILLVFVLVVAIAGGKVSFGPSGISMDTEGIWKLIQEARKAKSIAASPDAKAPKKRNVVKLPSITILWVDDQTENNIFEREALSKLGARIECYTTNDVACDVLDDVSPDVVISDIWRPGDEDGWQLLDAVREVDERLPFFFYTGEATDELKAEAGSKRANGVFDDPAELLNAIEALIG